MIFTFSACASARALSVAVLGVGLLGAGLLCVGSIDQQGRATPVAASAPIQIAAAAVAASSTIVPEPAAAPVSELSTLFQPSAPLQGSAEAPRLIRVSEARTPAMSPFQLAASGTGAENRALDCLTTAVYYEARGEGTDGMAAVAQVVLNRARHPAFPKSVCGVVFQGCQFSFACGGMNGRRDAALWERSRGIAEGALAGAVMARVGTATHFHATRINPRWSDLSRVATIGRHVFYSFAGRRGAPSTFLAAGGAGELPSRLAPSAPARPQAPVYAMLPSERPGAQAPATTPTASASIEVAAAPEPVAAAPTATPVASGVTPLQNAPVATPDPMTASTPVA